MEKVKELETVELMIKKYCHGVHGSPKGALCRECGELLAYAKLRREKCPHGDQKPFCSNCKIHCYKPEMKEKICRVMRYAGPRMLLDHPVIAMKHLIETKREKRKQEESSIDR